MKAWDIELGKMFKERDNPTILGAIIGEVVSIEPLKVSILDGKVLLEKEQLYISSSLKDKIFQAELKGNDCGNLTLMYASPPPTQYEVINLSLNQKDKLQIKLTFKFNLQDKVLLIPTSNEQTFFVVDIIQKVG